MESATLNYSPWPDQGKRVRFMFRRSIWVTAQPFYNQLNIKHTLQELLRFNYFKFWFPFFSFRTKYFHFYIGWKPITLDDSAFFWQELKQIQVYKQLKWEFCQLSARWGFGDIS